MQVQHAHAASSTNSAKPLPPSSTQKRPVSSANQHYPGKTVQAPPFPLPVPVAVVAVLLDLLGHPGLAEQARQSMTTGDEREFTTEEVAERHNVNPRTVRRWIDSGLLPATDTNRPGKARYRVKQRDLAAFEAGLARAAS